MMRLDAVIGMNSGAGIRDAVRPAGRCRCSQTGRRKPIRGGAVPGRAVRDRAPASVPLEAEPPIGERQLADALDGICLTNGGVAMIQFSGDRILYRVLDATPWDGAVLVTKKIAFSIAVAGKPGRAGGR